MKNNTNRIKYKFLSKFYDAFIGNSSFRKARKRAFSLVPFEAKTSILLVGVGTGEDLNFLPSDVIITGIDLSEEMLGRAKKRMEGKEASLLLMNAEELTFQDESFDIVILNLILSVVEHPQVALAEAVRVMKPNGEILIFDKFLDEEKIPGVSRKLMNYVTSLLGTDINRKFSEICNDLPVQVTYEEPSIFGGNYRIFLLSKK